MSQIFPYQCGEINFIFFLVYIFKLLWRISDWQEIATKICLGSSSALSPSLPYRSDHTSHSGRTISKPGNWHWYNTPCLFPFHQFMYAHLGVFMDSDKVSWLHFSDLYSCLNIFLAIYLLYKFLKKVFLKLF